MYEIEVYAFEDSAGECASDWTTQDINEAKKFAAEHGYRLIARTYEYTDSELIEGYTDATGEDDEADETGDDS